MKNYQAIKYSDGNLVAIVYDHDPDFCFIIADKSYSQSYLAHRQTHGNYPMLMGDFSKSTAIIGFIDNLGKVVYLKDCDLITENLPSHNPIVTNSLATIYNWGWTNPFKKVMIAYNLT